MKWKAVSLSAIVLSGVLFLSCSMKPKENVKIYLDLTPLLQSIQESSKMPNFELDVDAETDFQSSDPDFELTDQSSGPAIQAVFPAAPGAISPPAPAVIGNFDCFIVNVMGPGIPEKNTNPNESMTAAARHNLAVRGAPAAYQGITSQALVGTGPHTLELTVPAGPARMIQVLGLKSTSGGDPISQFCSGNANFVPNETGFFEVARAFIPNAFGDLSVELQETYGSLPWFHKFKRLANGTCKTYQGYYASSPNVSTTDKHVAIGISPGAALSGFKVNRFRVNMEGNAVNSTTVTAALYVGGATLAGMTATANEVYYAGESYTLPVNLPVQEYIFTFPTVSIPNGQSYLVVSGTENIEFWGDAGTYTGSAPFNSPQHAGAGAWAPVTGIVPHVMMERCF